MKTIYKQRILKLAQFLRSLPRKHFDLDITTNVGRSGERFNPIEDFIKIGKTKKAFNCGAAACAVGWCPAVFPKIVKWSLDFDGYGTLTAITPCEKGSYSGWRKVCEHLGLDTYQEAYLFYPSSYREGHMGNNSVATRLEQFVANDGIVPKKFRE